MKKRLKKKQLKKSLKALKDFSKVLEKRLGFRFGSTEHFKLIYGNLHKDSMLYKAYKKELENESNID